jgi:uncharacterized protein
MFKVRLLCILGAFCWLALIPRPSLAAAQDVPASFATKSFLTDLDYARQGRSDAQLRIAKAYNEGTVVWRNYSEAFRWFQEASKQGSTEATAWLGSLYLLGNGVAKDPVRASALLQQAVDKNEPVGLRFMGLRYEMGIGAVPDYPKAVDFYSRAVALGDPQANVRLGRMYLQGKGVARTPDKAFDLFTAGSRLGDSWAQLNLGEMYQSGFQPGTAAVNDAKGQSRSSSVGQPDFEKAIELYTASAASGNRIAAYLLGRIYENGNGTARNDKLAFDYYKQSATRRYVPALLALGEAHEFGRGTGVNLVHAFVAYSLAVEYNHNLIASRNLKRVTQKLSSSELQHAQDMLKAFKEDSKTALTKSIKSGSLSSRD